MTGFLRAAVALFLSVSIGLAWPVATALAGPRGLEVLGQGRAPNMDPDKRVALVIGNSAYQHAAPLANPKHDARDLSVALLELGFEVVDGFDLDHQGMQSTLRAFSQKLDGASMAVFFYAGHSLQVDGHNYMIPVDTRLDSPEDLEFEAVDMNQVLVMLERQPRIRVVILDACRNNPLAENLSRALSGSSRSVGGTSGGLARIDAASSGTLISFATNPGNVASDGSGRNSPYTASLLTHIRTPGLELQSMFRAVGGDVIEATGGKQVPWQNASLVSDEFFLAPARPGAKPKPPPGVSAGRLELELWVDVKDSGSVDELQSYLKKYPEGAFAELAQSRIKGLELQASQSGEAGSVEALYQLLAKRSIVVDDPQQPHEFYNNARLYDLRGDALNASKMYARYLQFGLPYVDPHLRYQAYLKATEGRAGAREVYNELAYDHRDDEVMQFAAALLQPREVRVEKLTAFAEAHPEFGPVQYELSRDYSYRRLGTQTTDDKRRERAHLRAFLDEVESGRVYRFYLDKLLVQEHIEEARERLAQLGGIGAHTIDQPITFSASRHGTGWNITAAITDPGYTDILAAQPGEDFVSLGTLPHTNPMTGQPMVKPFLELPPQAEAMTLRFKYRDARGQLQGPFSYAFDPDQALRQGAKGVLEITKTSWAMLRDFNGKRLVYFTHLIGQRCAIRQIRWGAGRSPDRTFSLPPCDRLKPFDIATDNIYTEIPTNVSYVTIQLTWYDGSESDVVRIDHRP